MTDINTRGKLPFTIVSSSVNTGYAAELTASVGQNIDITNYHKDEYGQLENSPLQGPFTNQHVGGNQHRHIKLNDGNDNSDNRPEAFVVSASSNSIKIYGPDVKGNDKPRAIFTRGNKAKSPINVSNIETSGNIAGNFEHNYQVVQSVGRRTSNNLINDNFIASGALTTKFITGSHQTYSLPDITNNSKSIFVQRFNAPGGKEESSRGALDREGEEFAPNNSLTTRNIKVRQPFYDQLTRHNKKFNFDNGVALPQETNLESIAYSDSFNVGTFETSGGGFYITEDGNYLYVVGGSSGPRVNWYQLSVPFEIRTANWIAFNTVLGGSPTGITFTPDGKTMFVCSGPPSGTSAVRKYNLSSAWNIVTAVFHSSLSLLPELPLAISFDSTGTRMFIASAVGTPRIIEYTLPAPWDISSAILKNSLEVSLYQSLIMGFNFDSSGLNLIVCGNGQDTLVKYRLQKDRDLSTAKYSVHVPITQDTFIVDVYVNSNKNKLYILGVQNDRIYQYDLDNYIFGQHSVNKNSINKIEEYYGNYISSSRNDNFWVQHAIPATDLRYKWIADSVSSSQQPIEYQNYNRPYSTSSFYNSNDAFTDLEFEQKGPFGDHLGISGAIDKDEVFVSTYTNTMYRDRKQFRFFSNQFYIDLSQASSDISQRDFTLSFWVKIPSSMPASGPYTFLKYSGSLGENELKFYCIDGYAMSSWAIENSTIPSDYQIENYEQTSNFNDDKWHLITIVSDKSTLLPRINGQIAQVLDSTLTKVYVDGGLVYEKQQKFTNFDISKITLNAGATAYDNTLIDDISIWDKALSEQQVLDTYRISNDSYGERPKKFLEHKFDNKTDLQPLHVYSNKIQDIENILLDEIGTKNAALVNYTSSVNLYPQLNKTISYSTYFNGPYQASNWKFTRNNEHPVTRKLATENTNIVSVLVPEGSITITRTIRGIPIRITLPGGRKQGTILNIKESPVYVNNKPLKHRFILKDSTEQGIGFELTHTYANNLQYFANKQLNDILGLNKKERQIYDTLFDYYNNNVDENENPIESLVGYTYSETIFPKQGETLLKNTRQRTDHITNQPGFSTDGYDRQLGTQRVFWRDNQEDRMRSYGSTGSYITSLGHQTPTNYNDLPFLTPSVAALEYITGTKAIGIGDSGDYNSNILIDIGYEKCAELNNRFSTWRIYYFDPSSGVTPELGQYYSYFIPSHNNPEYYFFKNINTQRTQSNAIIQNDQTNINGWDINDPSILRARPTYCYEQISFVSSTLSQANEKNYYTCSIDLGLNRYTEKISKKNPWYDNYQSYFEEIRQLSNDSLINYSNLPEFKISDHISDLILKYGSDLKKIKLESFKNNIQFYLRDVIEQQNDSLTKQENIKLNIKTVKKLLPYNGFYPQDRSLQLVNYFSSSYLATGAVKGGIQIYDSYEPQSSSLNYSGTLETYSKESSLLEPFYAPGIFYNLIKSGIAVSWSVFTGSAPIPDIGSEPFLPTSITPTYKIPFESILDIFNGIKISSSATPSENLIFKTKYYNNPSTAEDYGYLNTHACYFNPFFELEDKSNSLYSLSINNFLAETINFFLKDSKLNSFYSSPESQFSILESSKTYYMDIVLKNNNIKMIDAHSSSLRYKYGKMTGMYFGPGFYSGSVESLNQLDPSYCIYTPPYFYGDSIARISFTPSSSKKYTLEEIFSEINIEYFNSGLLSSSYYQSGTFYNDIAMNVGDSVQLFGSKLSPNLTVSSNSFIENKFEGKFDASSDSIDKQWVIYPKMEVPILDFSNQEYITASILDEVLDLTSYSASYLPVSSSGFGIGMWSGYGEIPSDQKGIFLQLKESFPNKIVDSFDFINNNISNSKTGSLLQACGFNKKEISRKLGELADSRDISEAIIIIPYSDKIESPKNIRLGYSGLSVNDTVQIEGKNFYKINKQIYDYQLNRINNNPEDSAVNLQDFSQLNGSIKETSISRMIKIMSNYVLPPNFDFLLNNDIEPFVMYIAEFTSTLDKQDLADIWQGVMPKIATRAEKEEQVISHKNTVFDFFHGQGLPKDVKFMIFKAKKRAEINYYKMTEDSTDDGLFPTIQTGKPPSPYSFNWPYDYCSIVETARVDIEIDYINTSGSSDI